MKLSACRVRMEVRQFVSLIEEVRRERPGGEGVRTTTVSREYDKGFLDAVRDLKQKLRVEADVDG